MGPRSPHLEYLKESGPIYRVVSGTAGTPVRTANRGVLSPVVGPVRLRLAMGSEVSLLLGDSNSESDFPDHMVGCLDHVWGYADSHGSSNTLVRFEVCNSCSLDSFHCDRGV